MLREEKLELSWRYGLPLLLLLLAVDKSAAGRQVEDEVAAGLQPSDNVWPFSSLDAQTLCCALLGFVVRTAITPAFYCGTLFHLALNWVTDETADGLTGVDNSTLQLPGKMVLGIKMVIPLASLYIRS